MVVELDTSIPNETTLAMIKPDAVAAGKARDIMHIIESNGFHIIEKKYVTLTEAEAKEFYGEHEGKPFFANLISFMTSGPIYALCMSKIGAISAWRALMGPTNSKEAREIKPSSLRAMFGTDNTQNACHGSDSTNSARREILFFFPDISFPQLIDQTELRKYIKKELEPILTKGLTVLSKHKPSAGKLEATKFLAQWLLDNNPSKGRIVTDEDFELGEEEEEEDFELIFEGAKEIDSNKPAKKEGEADGTEEYAEELEQGVDQLELEHAALKVQSHYRGFVARKQVKAKKESATKVVVIQNQEIDIDDEDPEVQLAATKLQSSFRAKQARNKVNEMKEENLAATKVQSSFRAKKARNKVKEMKEETKAATTVQAGFRSMKARKRVQEMKEENMAATKVQSSFRAKKAREEVKAMKEAKETS